MILVRREQILTHHLPAANYYLPMLSPTPLVPVSLDGGPEIWCKLDFLNPSGSTKDRIARFIVEKAWREGRIGPESVVVEASSGSTSIALALACAQMGLRFIALMPEGVSNERVKIIRAYGGEVRMTARGEGIRGAIRETERMAESAPVFLPRQFSNPDNAAAHRFGTAREILNELPVAWWTRLSAAWARAALWSACIADFATPDAVSRPCTRDPSNGPRRKMPNAAVSPHGFLASWSRYRRFSRNRRCPAWRLLKCAGTKRWRRRAS